MMESTGSRDQLIKSVLIMAGIPLAFSIASSFFARIKDRNISSLKDRILESEFDTLCDDDDHIVGTRSGNHLKEQLFDLRSKIKEVQDLEREIEDRFFRFIELKDQEYVLLGELESSRLETGLLQRRVKKLLKKTRESMAIIRKQNLMIEAQEAQMLSAEVEFKRKETVIEGYEREAQGTRAQISRLFEEKNDVLNKLETTENTLVSKVEAERILMEKYNQVVKELQNLQKNREGELKELIYLRWCHACLRQELARRNQLEQERKSEDKTSDDEPESGLRENVAPEECTGHELVHIEEPFLGPGQQHMKKRSLVRKFKKWVEGSEKHHEAKCFRSRSVVDEAEKRQSDGRKSFSSV